MSDSISLEHLGLKKIAQKLGISELFDVLYNGLSVDDIAKCYKVINDGIRMGGAVTKERGEELFRGAVSIVNRQKELDLDLQRLLKGQ